MNVMKEKGQSPWLLPQASYSKPDSITLRFVALNLLDKGSTEDYVRRLSNMATLIKSIIPDWDVIGIQEARHKRTRKWPWSPAIARALKIPCPASDSQAFTSSCLASLLKGPDSNCIVMNQGRTGLIANPDKFELVTKHWKRIGDSSWGEIKPELLCYRLKIIRSGGIVPVLSIHITSKDDNDLKLSMVKEINSESLNWYRKGDIVPVLLGDFNFGRKDTGVYAEQDKTYYELGNLFNKRDIVMKIWVGRAKPFEIDTANHHLISKPVDCINHEEFKNSAEYTDHAAVSGVIDFFNPVTA